MRERVLVLEAEGRSDLVLRVLLHQHLQLRVFAYYIFSWLFGVVRLLLLVGGVVRLVEGGSIENNKVRALHREEVIVSLVVDLPPGLWHQGDLLLYGCLLQILGDVAHQQEFIWVLFFL